MVRLEKLGLGTRAGKIKISGAILCVSGAMIACLYKGETFHLIHKTLQHHVQVKSSVLHKTRGTILLIGSCLSYSSWYILQVCIDVLLALSISILDQPWSSHFEWLCDSERCLLVSLIGQIAQGFPIQISYNHDHLYLGFHPISSNRSMHW